jgi:hypothetical protein
MFYPNKLGKEKVFRKELIQEQIDKPVTQSSLQSIVDPIRDRGLTLDVYESKKAPIITLSRIEVPKEMRGTGMGTQALQDLSQYADQSAKTIALSPSKDFGASSVNRLKDFYKRFGFIENKGKNKDFSISESMYRLPTQTTRKDLIQEQVNALSNDIYSGLQESNKSTFPKIPVGKVFKNPQGKLPENKTKSFDDIMEMELSLPTKEINIDAIVPTQLNLNFDNLKKVFVDVNQPATFPKGLSFGKGEFSTQPRGIYVLKKGANNKYFAISINDFIVTI